MKAGEIIFKTFQTHKKKYVYDRQTNAIVRISQKEYDELKQIEDGKLAADCSEVVAKYQERGLLWPNTVKKIQHPQTELLEHFAQKGLRMLTLQVTQQCNLRCGYCVYSGIYKGNRVHNAKRMSLETAKAAIDFFLEHSVESKEAYIGFYGGEPLLEFELIKECVAYVRQKVEGKKVVFNMTTNGTLLSGERVEFLVENDFNLAISMDGSEKEHDINRKFINGKGSFSTVIKNIKALKEKYPEYENRCLKIFTTVNPYMDIGCVIQYFKSSDIFNDEAIVFNTMRSSNLLENISYEEKYFQIRNYEYIKTLFMLVGKLDKKNVSGLTLNAIDLNMRIKKAIASRVILGDTIHHGGPCLPGIMRLFVNVDGEMYPCERINEQLDYYKIGSVFDGFDLDKMRRLMNIGKLTEKECISCWNLRQCMMCSADIEFEKEPTREEKLVSCKTKIQNTEFALHEQCVLNEFGYTLGVEVL